MWKPSYFLGWLLLHSIAASYLRHYPERFTHSRRWQLCAKTPQCSTQDSGGDIVGRIKAAPTSKQFVSLLKRAARSHSQAHVKLTNPEKQVLLSEIDLRFSQMSLEQLSDCLWSVGLMKLPRGDPAVAQLTADIFTTLGHIQTRQSSSSVIPTDTATNGMPVPPTPVFGVTDKALASILNGLVNTGVKWVSLPADRRELLLSRVVESVFVPAIQQRQYGYLPDVVWSLGKLSVELRMLRGDVKKVLMQAIVAAAAEPLRSNDYDGRSSNAASDVATSTGPKGRNGSISNIPGSSGSSSVSTGRLVYGLSLMGARWHAPSTGALTEPAQHSLLAALARHWERQEMNEMTLVNTVYALGKMECPYGALPPTARHHLGCELIRLGEVMGPAAVGNVVWALGKMKARWGILPVALRGALCRRLVAMSPLGGHALTMAYTGLAKMGVRWGGEGDGDEGKRRGERGSQSEDGGSWSGADNHRGARGEMGERSERSDDGDLLPLCRDALVSGAALLCEGGKASEQQVSNLVWALGSMGAVWHDKEGDDAQNKTAITGRAGVESDEDEVASGMIESEILRKETIGREKPAQCLSVARHLVPALTPSIASLAGVFSDQGLTNVVYGMARMGCRFADPSLRAATKAISSVLFEVGGAGEMGGVGGVEVGTGKGQGKSQGMGKEGCRLSRMDGHSVALLVWSFGHGDEQWLPSSTTTPISTSPISMFSYSRHRR